MEISPISSNDALTRLPAPQPLQQATSVSAAASAAASQTNAAIAQTNAISATRIADLTHDNALLKAIEQTLVQFNLAERIPGISASSQTDATTGDSGIPTTALATGTTPLFTDATPFTTAVDAAGATSDATSSSASLVASLVTSLANPSTTSSTALPTASAQQTNLTVASTQLTPIAAEAVMALAGALYQAVSPITYTHVSSLETITTDAVRSVNPPAAIDPSMTAFRGGYDQTGFKLASLAHQANGPIDSTVASNDALATLRANYQNLLATASGPASNQAAYAGAPTLQAFLQTLMRNFSPGFTATPGVSAVGNLIETTA
ncbi:hypothetical protein [Burkholderia sp. L27(2015)]|uniref:hypothetical protein n=1 Tax=Burkholderia sp. L27(2015) TaxID=1641858 RepID=UPI00131BEAC0|nr:hypothetical protein [Burkholderia sp. L27(2015)]